MAPKEAVRVMYEKAGRVMSASSLSELPGDHRQVYNFKSHSACTSGIISKTVCPECLF